MTATFELPGLNKENVSIDIHNNVLTVSGESKFDSDSNESGYLLRERRFGRFSRSLPVPEGVKVCLFPPCVHLDLLTKLWLPARGNQGGDGKWCPDGHLPARRG